MNTQTHVNSEDPRDLERNGESLRADMDETLEALQEKLSPGRAVDRTLQFVREHGSEISREVSAVVREHPVPLLITAVGVTWFTASLIRSRADASGYSNAEYDATDRSAGYDYDYGYQESESRTEGLRARADHLKHAAQNKLHHAVDTARGQTQRASTRLHGLVREQPMALGALALAAGAILGAAFPQTQYERQTVRPLRDRALARAEEVGGRSYEKVRSALKSGEESRTPGTT
jgi:ElaB/YqjD/DUF883 family membrane-anchored ribosome-binding protein